MKCYDGGMLRRCQCNDIRGVLEENFNGYVECSWYVITLISSTGSTYMLR